MSINRWGRRYDHAPVCCTLNMKVKREQNKCHKRLDFKLLKSCEQTRSKFNKEVSNNLHKEQHCVNNPTESLSNLQIAVAKAAENVLPTVSSKPSRKRFISDQTRDLFSKRQKLYHQMTPNERKELSKYIA